MVMDTKKSGVLPTVWIYIITIIIKLLCMSALDHYSTETDSNYCTILFSLCPAQKARTVLESGP